MKMAKLLLIAMVGVSCGILQAACQEGSHAAPQAAPYLLGETREYVQSGGGQGGRPWVFWLDDDVLTFAGGPLQAGQLGIRAEEIRLYIWKIGSDPQKYAEGVWPPAGVSQYDTYFCASKGLVYYSTGGRIRSRTSDGEIYSSNIMSGQIGHELPGNRRFLTKYSGVGSHPISTGFEGEAVSSGRLCNDYVSHADFKAPWYVNYTRDLILELPGPGRDEPGKMFGVLKRPDGHALRTFPLPQDTPSPSPLFAVDAPSWTSGFVFWQTRYDIERDGHRGKTLLVYEINSAAIITTKSISIPPEISRGDIAPYRNGLFYISQAGEKISDVRRDGGIYLVLDDGNLRKIVPGFFSLAAVSPNGCKGAFYDHKPTGNPFYVNSSLVVFDLCQLGRH